MEQIAALDAQRRLPELLERVTAGERIAIVDDNGETLEIVRRVVQEAEAHETDQREAIKKLRAIRDRAKPDPEGWTVSEYIEYGRRS